MTDNILDFFRESEDTFTIYVVEQRFAVGRGSDYFKSFKGKSNLIDTSQKARQQINSILKWINKRVPSVAELITACFFPESSLEIPDVVSALSKLFSVESHQAAGPNVIDPIILQEGSILPKYLNQLIHLHKESILRPVIIILLKDNDFDRAKHVLSNCPHGTNIKMIRNSGETIMYKVVNTGTDSMSAFIDAFAGQCFSTCSCTNRDVLLNDEWAEFSIIHRFAPQLMRIRTNLLCDEKKSIRNDISGLMLDLAEYPTLGEHNKELLQAFTCIAHLFRVYCNDGGQEDMKIAHELAKELNNEILLAHVYKYSYFMGGLSFSEKLSLLSEAQALFEHNGMIDHAIYCKNNRLVRDFDTDHISVRSFLNLREEALNNVPGLVGISHIYNNAGVSLLMTGNPGDALPSLIAALDYARQPERSVQKLAILSNIIIAKAYDLQPVDENELRRTLNLIFDNMGIEKLPFLSARYAMNIIVAAFQSSENLGQGILNSYPIRTLVQKGLSSNVIGSGQIIQQMGYLQRHYSKFTLLDEVQVPKVILETTGVRKSFIERNGYNPILFSTWI